MLQDFQDERSTYDLDEALNPLGFKRIPRCVSLERFKYLTCDWQLVIDVAKKGLKEIRRSYFSLNGEEQDITTLLQQYKTSLHKGIQYPLNII